MTGLIFDIFDATACKPAFRLSIASAPAKSNETMVAIVPTPGITFVIINTRK